MCEPQSSLDSHVDFLLRRSTASLLAALSKKVSKNFLELIHRWVHVLARSVQLSRAKSYPLFRHRKQEQIYPALHVIRG